MEKDSTFNSFLNGMNADQYNYFRDNAQSDNNDIAMDSITRFMDNPDRPSPFYTQGSRRLAYSLYLRFKFAYFFQKEIGKSDDEVLSFFDIPDEKKQAFIEIFKFFTDNLRRQTAVAFLLRNNQLGDDAISHWYNHLPEFDDWKNYITNTPNDYLSQLYDMGSHKDIPLVIDSQKASLIRSRIIEKFCQLFSNNIFEDTAYLQAFTQAIVETTDAVLVDYLTITTGTHGPEIQFLLVSDKKINDAERQSGVLRYKENYLQGHGITGSILVARQYNNRLHVGSNNLNYDSRQSTDHENVYSKVYKQNTNSFWLFPLYNGKKMYAAFRVINKKKDSACQYWTYADRALLLDIARWFPSLWKMVSLFLDSFRKKYDLLEDSHNASNRIIGNLGIGQWLPKENLEILLSHLSSVVHRMIESHAMSTLFVITGAGHVDECVQRFHEYPIKTKTRIKTKVNYGTLEEISKTYRKINPRNAFFHFSADGSFYGVRQLVQADGEEGISVLCKYLENQQEYLALLAEGDKKSIRIFYCGKVVADYYLSEGNGRWRLRFIEDLCTIFKSAHVSEAICEQLAEMVFDLSYRRIGSMIIITDENIKDDIRSSEDIDAVKGSFITASIESIIHDLATLDGALILRKNGEVVSAGNILKSNNIEMQSEISEHIKRSQKGARHTAAGVFATAHPDACVVVISENRGLCVLHNRKAVMWNDVIEP